MKITSGSTRQNHVARITIFFFMVALITGMVGCDLPPAEIRDWYDLHAIIYNLRRSYLLMNDLDSTTPGYIELASDTANGGKGWEPIGAYGEPFIGNFDGLGYEIRGLFINRLDENEVGLFGLVDEGGVIKNVGIVNATIAGKQYIGCLVGKNLGTVTSSYSRGNVVNGDDSMPSIQYKLVIFSTVGGSVTTPTEKTLTYDASTVVDLVATPASGYQFVNWTGDVGTIADVNAASTTITMNASYSIRANFEPILQEQSILTISSTDGGSLATPGEGIFCCNFSVVNATVAVNHHIGCLVVRNLGTMTNSYLTGSVAGDQYVGGLVGVNEGTVTNSYYDYDEVLINGENIITIGALFGEDFEQWLANGKFLNVNQRLSQENGSYVINTVSDFKELLAFGQDGSLKFRLTNDLDLSNETNFYIPYLAGQFDGSGHEILNLNFNFDFISQVGLFGYLASGGKITQVGVGNLDVTATYRVGGLVGENDGTVSNSYSSGNVAGDDCIGGLVGYNRKGTVSNSYSTSNVAGYFTVGGVVGENDGTVSNSYSSGNVIGDEYVGGVVGYNWKGVVSNSYSIGSVSGFFSIGGLVGVNEDTVTNSYSSGSVTGKQYAGGLVGTNRDTVTNSYSTGSTSGDQYVGGLVGLNDGTMTTSYSSGSVTGVQYVGGLVGINKDSLTNSHSIGNVTGSSGVGGLVGTNDGNARDSYFAGSVAGEWDVGGVVGTNYGTVRGSYSTGSVTGNNYVGGIVGGNDGIVTNSHSTGSVTGMWDVGGLMGSNSGTVTNSYSTGSVSGSSITSGLVAMNGADGTVSDSFSVGSVVGSYYIGGLVAVNFGAISNSYATSKVTGDDYVGGLVGVNWGGSVSNSFWDTKTSGQITSAGGTGKTTTEMQEIGTFTAAAWDICAVAPGATNPCCIWNIVYEQTYPFLSWHSVF
jgi:hypothetical protein